MLKSFLANLKENYSISVNLDNLDNSDLNLINASCDKKLPKFLIDNLNSFFEKNMFNFRVKNKNEFVEIVESSIEIIRNFSNRSIKFRDEIHRENGINVLFKYLKNQDFLKKTSEKKLFKSLLRDFLGCLENLCRSYESFKTEWKNENSVEIILSISEKSKSIEDCQLACYMILAFITEEEEISKFPEIKKSINGIVGIISEITLKLKNKDKVERDLIEINELKKSFEILVQEKLNTVWNLIELLQALYHMSVNDSLKINVYFENQMSDHLRTLIEYGNDIEKAFSIKLLWQLCFNIKVSVNVFEDKSFFNKIDEFTKSPLEELAKNSLGCIWTVKNKQNDNLILKQDKSEHIMISYNRETRDLCLKIKEELENKGHKIWIDVYDMHGSSLEAMAEAIEKSKCVLLCMTEKYKQSSNCRMEAEYVVQQKKNFIPLIMQKNYMPDGWLGLILGAKIYVNFKKYTFEECIRNLSNEIQKVFDDETPETNNEQNKKPAKTLIKKENLDNWNEERCNGLDSLTKCGLPISFITKDPKQQYQNCKQAFKFLECMTQTVVRFCSNSITETTLNKIKISIKSYNQTFIQNCKIYNLTDIKTYRDLVKPRYATSKIKPITTTPSTTSINENTTSNYLFNIKNLTTTLETPLSLDNNCPIDSICEPRSLHITCGFPAANFKSNINAYCNELKHYVQCSKCKTINCEINSINSFRKHLKIQFSNYLERCTVQNSNNFISPTTIEILKTTTTPIKILSNFFTVTDTSTMNFDNFTIFSTTETTKTTTTSTTDTTTTTTKTTTTTTTIPTTTTTILNKKQEVKDKKLENLFINFDTINLVQNTIEVRTSSIENLTIWSKLENKTDIFRGIRNGALYLHSRTMDNFLDGKIDHLSKYLLIKVSSWDLRVDFLYRRKYWVFNQAYVWKPEWNMMTVTWSEFEGLNIFINGKKLFTQQNYEYYSSNDIYGTMSGFNRLDDLIEENRLQRYLEKRSFRNQSQTTTSVIFIGLSNKLNRNAKKFYMNYRDQVNLNSTVSNVYSESILLDEMFILNHRIKSKEINSLYLKEYTIENQFDSVEEKMYFLTKDNRQKEIVPSPGAQIKKSINTDNWYFSLNGEKQFFLIPTLFDSCIIDAENLCTFGFSLVIWLRMTHNFKMYKIESIFEQSLFYIGSKDFKNGLEAFLYVHPKHDETLEYIITVNYRSKNIDLSKNFRIYLTDVSQLNNLNCLIIDFKDLKYLKLTWLGQKLVEIDWTSTDINSKLTYSNYDLTDLKEFNFKTSQLMSNSIGIIGDLKKESYFHIHKFQLRNQPAQMELIEYEFDSENPLILEFDSYEKLNQIPNLELKGQPNLIDSKYGKSLLLMNDQKILFKNVTNCFGNIDQCKNGYTLKITFCLTNYKIKNETKRINLISNSGVINSIINETNYNFNIYYDLIKQNLIIDLKIPTRIYHTELSVKSKYFQWFNLHVTWDILDGLRVYLNNRLMDHNKGIYYYNSKLLKSERNFIIGRSDDNAMNEFIINKLIQFNVRKYPDEIVQKSLPFQDDMTNKKSSMALISTSLFSYLISCVFLAFSLLFLIVLSIVVIRRKASNGYWSREKDGGFEIKKSKLCCKAGVGSLEDVVQNKSSADLELKNCRSNLDDYQTNSLYGTIDRLIVKTPIGLTCKPSPTVMYTNNYNSLTKDPKFRTSASFIMNANQNGIENKSEIHF
ncbi:unnamed protein product [Brachionus calyciflorus]|uniref:TIR domain-containing protein n=1 Tax=Brachionus calyciflorus TaxID=104777 RepID=A0A813Z006_9BILA|nr:unnamed protein product [Brachionus calyciflorus]